MRLFVPLLLCATALAQDSSPKNPEGGRDSQEGPGIHFVRWQKSVEAGAIYLSAWRGLEPHLVDLGRRRLVDFEGDAGRAGAYFAAEKQVAIVVAFGAPAADAARKALPGTPVIEVSDSPTADVVLRVDRERLAILLGLFQPRARKVAVFGPGEERLMGFDTKPCTTAADALGCDVAWVAEGGTLPEGVKLPVVATATDVPAALTVRPDPDGAGLKVAALVVGKLRDGKDVTPQHVSRLQVTVDLDAARAAGLEVPLSFLARADVVRRAP